MSELKIGHSFLHNDRSDGHYYISYLAGNRDGYEPDPLYMGLAKSSDPTDPNGFQRFPEPILRPDDPDVRCYEAKTLYKSFLFYDDAGVTGHPYVNAYNAKDDSGREFACSRNLVEWTIGDGEPLIKSEYPF